MAKANVVARWIEMSQSYLHDNPPKTRDYEAFLFTNECEVRQVKSGLILLRTRNIQEIHGATKQELNDRIADFVRRADVRILRRELETNDVQELPTQSRKVTPELLNGTADIYERNEDEEISENTLCVA